MIDYLRDRSEHMGLVSKSIQVVREYQKRQKDYINNNNNGKLCIIYFLIQLIIIFVNGTLFF